MAGSDFLGALRDLCELGVEFIVVRGLATVLNGAPVNTFDPDMCMLRMRIMSAGFGGDRGHTVEMEIGSGLRIFVLDSARLSRSRTRWGGEEKKKL